VREGKGWVGMAIREVELGRIGFNFTHRGQLICLLVFLLLNDESLSLMPCSGPLSVYEFCLRRDTRLVPFWPSPSHYDPKRKEDDDR